MEGKRMTPDQLLRAMAIIIEEQASGTRDRVTGDMQPLSRDELIAIRDRIETLIAMNMPRREADEPNHSNA